MPLCCSLAADPIVAPLPPCTSCSTLEDCLNDKLASLLLVKYAETEYSTENVLFLLEVHQLNRFVQLRTRLRRMLTGGRRTGGPMRRSTDRSTDSRSTGERERPDIRRASTGLQGAHQAKALELTRSLIRKYVASENLCLTATVGGALRKWLREDRHTVPNELICQAYAQTMRTVKHDIFPRFRSSAHFDHLVCVHLSRTLQHEAFRGAFESELQPMQKAALEVWTAARAVEERFDEATAAGTTAAGASSSGSKEAAVHLEAHQFVSRFEPQLTLVCPEEAEALKQMALPSSKPLEMACADVRAALTSLIHAAQNMLVDPYVAFLAAEKSKGLQRQLGVRRTIDLSSCRADSFALAPSGAPPSEGEGGSAAMAVDEDDAGPPADDWAAGW